MSLKKSIWEVKITDISLMRSRNFWNFFSARLEEILITDFSIFGWRCESILTKILGGAQSLPYYVPSTLPSRGVRDTELRSSATKEAFPMLLLENIKQSLNPTKLVQNLCLLYRECPLYGVSVLERFLCTLFPLKFASL